MSLEAIGKAAGMLWKLLARDGAFELRQLVRLAGVESSRVYLALGWLAREVKIAFSGPESKRSVSLVPSEIELAKRSGNEVSGGEVQP
jgi:hypothetical protein